MLGPPGGVRRGPCPREDGQTWQGVGSRNPVGGPPASAPGYRRQASRGEQSALGSVLRGGGLPTGASRNHLMALGASSWGWREAGPPTLWSHLPALPTPASLTPSTSFSHLLPSPLPSTPSLTLPSPPSLTSFPHPLPLPSLTSFPEDLGCLLPGSDPTL